MNKHIQKSQHGAATLATTLVLSFVILLSVAFLHRSVLFDVKTSTNQYHAAQAREAAEAGLDWAVAQLNSNTPIGDDCLASGSPSATPFRERALVTLQAACAAVEGGWACQCPTTGEPTSDPDAPLTFTLHATAGTEPNVIHLVATGSSAGGGARAQLQLQLGRLPGLDTLPAAALTVRGTAAFGPGSFGAHHISPETGGLTLHVGGVVQALPMQLSSAPGTPVSASVAAEEPALAQLTPHGLFASMFRMDKAAWRAQPVVQEVDCSHACDAVLALAASTHQLIWLRNGLRLESPLNLGTPLRPVLLLVDGPVELHARAVIHGLVYGTNTRWADSAGASIHGAVVLEDALLASGDTQIHHHHGVLQALHQHTGTYARAPGSWRDF